MISVNKEITMLGHIIILHFSLCSFYAAAYPMPGACIGVKCPGPVKFYEDLQCRPVYKNFDDCCAIKYDCGHLENRSPDKCYANRREYNIGEELTEVARCDFKCICDNWRGNLAQFACAVSDFILPPTDPGCYRERNATDCFPGHQICPENPEDIPTCEVDGKIIKDGEYFQPEADKDKGCYCGPGFTGELVEPYCRDYSNKNNQEHCGAEIAHRAELENHCAPVFRDNESPQTDCNIDWRCQNDKDEVIKKEEKPEGMKEENSNVDNMICKLGNLTMQIGDELNQDTGYDSVCVKCICDVPPLPTCQYLPRDVCDFSTHRGLLDKATS